MMRLAAILLTLVLCAVAGLLVARANAATPTTRIAAEAPMAPWLAALGDHCARLRILPGSALAPRVVEESLWPDWQTLGPAWRVVGYGTGLMPGVAWTVIALGMPDGADQVWPIGLNGLTISWRRTATGEYELNAEPTEAETCRPVYRQFLPRIA